MINENQVKRDIIVVGASAGGVETLSRLFQDIPKDFPGIIACVIHRSPIYNLHLAKVLGRKAAIPILEPGGPTLLKPGTVYLAPRDHHMMFSNDHLVLNRSPKEHFTRPAVDPLLCSAGEYYGPRVVGVLLTGGGDDGVIGLIKVKAGGGLAIVQDPTEAVIPTMPLSALSQDHVDLVLSLSKIPSVLMALAEGRTVTHPH